MALTSATTTTTTNVAGKAIFRKQDNGACQNHPSRGKKNLYLQLPLA